MEHGNVIIVNILWDKKKRYLFCANVHLLFTSRMKKTNITKLYNMLHGLTEAVSM